MQKTLNELLVAQKARKGKSTGVTKRGAFWLVIKPIKIRSYGGDGIGQSRHSLWHNLEFQHFRNGEMDAKIVVNSWHQNDGDNSQTFDVSEILDVTNVEDLIAMLKGKECGETHAYSDRYEADLTSSMRSLGLSDFPPGPDEDPK